MYLLNWRPHCGWNVSGAVGRPGKVRCTSRNMAIGMRTTTLGDSITALSPLPLEWLQQGAISREKAAQSTEGSIVPVLPFHQGPATSRDLLCV